MEKHFQSDSLIKWYAYKSKPFNEYFLKWKYGNFADEKSQHLNEMMIQNYKLKY